MGRRKKFRPGDVVTWVPEDTTPYGVVVDYYRGDGPNTKGQYLVLPTTSYHTQMKVYGGPKWFNSNELDRVDTEHNMHTIVSRYRNNNAIGLKQRGCYCHCCIHYAIPPSVVNRDGTFKEEE